MTVAQAPDHDALARRFFDETRVLYAGVLDRNGAIIMVSNAALIGVGTTRDEVMGRPFWDTPWFTHREESQATIRRLVETAIAGETAHEDVWNLRADGSEALVRATAEPLLGPDEAVEEILVSGFDDTARWQAVEKQALILREADHRMKNILTIIKAVARLSARSSASLDAFLDAFDQRLVSLASSHELLQADGRESIDVGSLIRTQLTPFADETWSQIAIEGPPLALPSGQTHTLGLVLHEFATNALKFGALSRRAGRIDITWTPADEHGRATLWWCESGGPRVEGAQGRGFGTSFVSALLAPISGGEAPLLEFPPEGFRATLRLASAS